MVDIKSAREIDLMREACRITRITHEELAKALKPGITTYELDKLAEEVIRSNGGIPAQKNYPSGMPGVPAFPATICVSINDEVIHGIPSKKTYIKDGDVVSFDLVVEKNGFHGDAARTYIVGKSDNET